MIIENRMGERRHIPEDNSLQGYSGRKYIEVIEAENPAYMEIDDDTAIVSFIFKMPTEYVDILICLELGMTSPQILKLLNIRNLGRLRKRKKGMREVASRLREEVLGYN